LSGFETLIYEKKDHIAYVTLNRPQALNVYNIRMRDDLYQALGAIKDDPEVRVAIFKGAGEKAFCAGADLSEFLSAPSPVIARQARFGRDVWGLFLSIPQPLIAAVHGYVLGSGIEIALSCDIRIASEDAKFALPEVGLPRAIGMARALEMLLANRRLSSEEAYAMGLVNQVVPKNKLLETAEEMAKKIASFHPMAVRNAKQAVLRGLDLSLSEGLELERRLAIGLRAYKGEHEG
jgi:enoyl-CoA hydratase/carnithine racemase